MRILNPTPPESLTDPRGRPYFLWDSDLTIEAFRAGLADRDPQVSAFLLGKLLRQAKPDDVFTFNTPESIAARWSEIERYLGESAAMWRWLLGRWGLLP